MAETEQLIEAFDSRARRRVERRDLFRAVLGTAAVGGAFAYATAAQAQTVTDADVLNFALNLEYLEANFYAFAVTGAAIPANLTSGTGKLGAATGGHAVPFADPAVKAYALEIAADELAHVAFLRGALGTTAAVAQPAIDVGTSPNGAFSRAAQAAQLVPLGTSFDPYANDNNFLLGSFIFEDVGVTAYKGAAALISNKTYLEAAAGILAVEAYHASIVRTSLYARGLADPASNLIAKSEAISKARDDLDGSSDDDQGVAPIGTMSNIVPLDSNGLAYSRTTGQVLNIVYLNNRAVTMGGFFPAGVNGNIVTSAAN